MADLPSRGALAEMAAVLRRFSASFDLTADRVELSVPGCVTDSAGLWEVVAAHLRVPSAPPTGGALHRPRPSRMAPLANPPPPKKRRRASGEASGNERDKRARASSSSSHA